MYEMGKRITRLRIWFTKHVPVPLFIVGSVVIIVLCFNDDVSLSRNYAYLQEIVKLKKEIRINRDSAQYYRNKREQLTTSSEILEHVAREQYQMQKSDEEVYILQ